MPAATSTMPNQLLRAMFDAAVAAALPARIVPGHLPAPPKVAKALCSWAARAFMSPPLSEDSSASNGLTGLLG